MQYTRWSRLAAVVSAAAALYVGVGPAWALMESYTATGEIECNAKPQVRSVWVCDFNNEGRQDLVLFYRGMGPQFFFNRGLRCFGFAKTQDPASITLPDDNR